jgi:hydroxymethylglutaryl-CoA lyase
MFEQLPSEVSVYEVSPRDGLQNERVTVPLRDKLRLVRALEDAGIRRIEITSFVSPKWIPQLGDADDLVVALREGEAAAGRSAHASPVAHSALVPNAHGLDRAREAGLTEIAVFLSASETHNRRNVNKSVADSLAAFSEVVAEARRLGMRVRGYVSTVWGCPYEGDVPVEASLRVAKRLVEFGCYQVSLGDTIGVGTPVQTARILKVLISDLSAEKLALHMHDTRGTALANIVVGLELGIRDFDASVGGMGGCPYAPGAAGNVSTEDLVYLLEGMGIRTGIDLSKLLEAGRVAESIVGRALPSKVLRAGARSLRV